MPEIKQETSKKQRAVAGCFGVPALRLSGSAARRAVGGMSRGLLSP